MEFQINEDITSYSSDEITSLIEQGNVALDALFAVEAPSVEQVAEAERITAAVASLTAEATARAEAAERMSALRQARAEASSEASAEAVTEDENNDDDEPVAVEDAEAEAEANNDEEKAVTAAAPLRRALSDERPTPPAASPLVITAAADVPQFATGSEIADLDALGVAVVNRMRGFPGIEGRKGGAMSRYGVASFRKTFSADLITDGPDAVEVIRRAGDESRLSGGSLVAAGGWCAPSETLYDFCDGESTDGIISLPEFNVRRGGIRYTPGPSLGDFMGQGFWQTEAQAIAGTAKPCIEIDCPDFTEVRLDAVGLCVKVPILTNAAYPELVRRSIALALIAHQHYVSQVLINKMVTASGAAIAAGNVGSIASGALNAVELVAETERGRLRLKMGATMEVVLPFWVKAVIRADLASRTGVDLLAVSDADITRYFSARNIKIQWVYNWQQLAENAVGYPQTVQALVFPAGTFTKGVSDVINLDAVYDAAGLTENTYTGLFFEEGVLLAKNCYKSKLVTIPVCAAGVTGAASNAACFTVA